MKLNHLPSTTQSRTSEANERVRQAVDEKIRRVDAMEGVDDDRQRSRQQELAEVDPRVLGPFGGGEQVLQDARAVAAQLTLLGSHAEALVKLRALATVLPHIDDKA